MTRAIISFGSNIDPEENIGKVRDILSSDGLLNGESVLVRTKPVGIVDQPDFLNGAFLIETEMAEEELRKYLKALETFLGRVREGGKDGPRTMDLDIIVFNGEIVDDDYYKYGFVRLAVLELEPGLEEV